MTQRSLISNIAGNMRCGRGEGEGNISTFGKLKKKSSLTWCLHTDENKLTGKRNLSRRKEIPTLTGAISRSNQEKNQKNWALRRSEHLNQEITRESKARRKKPLHQ